MSKTSFKTSPAEMELLGVLFVIPVLFQKDETVSRAKDLLSGNPKVHVSVQRVELQAYLFAEALNIPFKKIMNLAE